MNEDRKKIYQEALVKWGLTSQIKMTIEEMAELIVELCKIGRSKNGTTYHRIREELADATICLEQMKWVFGEGKIEEIERIKLNRLTKILKDEA